MFLGHKCVFHPIQRAMSMTPSVENKHPISWVKDNVSGILLLVTILIIIIGIVIYSMPQSLTELVAKRETVGTNYSDMDADKNQTNVEIDKNQAMAKSNFSEPVVDNWPEDAISRIDNSTSVVGESDHNGQRLVISEQEIIGLEKHTDRDKKASDEQSLPKPDSDKLNSEIQLSDSLAATLNKQLTNATQSNTSDTSQNAALSLILTPKEQLLAISPYLYTVRLSEISSTESLLQFVELHGLPKEGISIYQTMRNNESWYVVIFGQFDSFQSAKKAAVALSASSTNLSTWVDMYETIHQDLRLTNE